MTDALDRAARELLARIVGTYPGQESDPRIAAILRFAAEQRAAAIDAAFSLLIERLAPFLDDQSLHAVHAEVAKIEALKHERVYRLAPAPARDEKRGRCARCGYDGVLDVAYSCSVCCEPHAPARDDAGGGGVDMPPVCPGCHAVGEERCAPGCIDAEIEAEHRHAIESGDYDDPEPGEYDDDEIIARGSIPPYVACGMWLEDEESRTGEWFVRDIFDVDDGCMALMERAGCEPFHMHTSELRKHWRLARDYDPNAEVT